MSTAGALKAIDLALSLLSIIEHANRVASVAKEMIERSRAEGRELTEEDFRALDDETKTALADLRLSIERAKGGAVLP